MPNLRSRTLAEHVHRRASAISDESFRTYQRSLEPQPLEERSQVNATEIGKALEPRLSPVIVKDLLAQIGFLQRSDHGWLFTETALSSGLAEERQNSAGETYCVWRPGIVPHLQRQLTDRVGTAAQLIVQWLSPSSIGRSFRQQVSAASVNEMLREMGYQEKSDDGGWQACGQGCALSRPKAWFDGKGRPAAIEWKPDVVRIVGARFQLVLAGYLEEQPPT